MDIASALRELSASHPYVGSKAPNERVISGSDAIERRRIAFHVSLVEGVTPAGGSVVDVGGGLCLFSLACALSGFRARLVDDFAEPWHPHAPGVLEFLAERGVQIDTRDAIKEGLGLADESVDTVTSFDSMEHWHASPKRLFSEIVKCLRPGGAFILGVPNAVNLRKRITVPFGVGKWTSMTEWYEEPVFRGHVREPDVSDLRYIGRDMGLVNVRILGRNWQGYWSRHSWARTFTPAVDNVLRLRPSLCSDLYLVGRKPLGGSAGRSPP